MSRGFVGIDIGKKTLEICRLRENHKIEWNRVNTDEKGITSLLKWIRDDDTVALEACSQSFRIAKTILAKTECEVLVLNPGDIAVIYRSMKKTDKEDCLKLARLISRIPAEELPVVTIPSDEIEDARRLLKEQEYWSSQSAAGKNRLHSLFVQDGLTLIRKKDLAGRKNREKSIAELSERFKEEAERIHNHLCSLEENLKVINVRIKNTLCRDTDYTTIAMSMPGIGPITALSFYAYLGNCSRFSSPGQVSYYAGLVPRVDISGDTKRYGHITKRGAHLLRRSLIQGAWALIRSDSGGDIKNFYERLYPRIGKKKAIVATARKMLEVFYSMIRSGTLYNAMTQTKLNEKLSFYGIT